MIVADTSSLVSLASGDTLDVFLAEFDVHTTETVIGELEDTCQYDDASGDAADIVLQHQDGLTVHQIDDREFQSSRVDEGEAGCVLLARERDADFLVTDDLRALPELQTLVDARVAISPIVLRGLVQRGVLKREGALDRLEDLAETRDWIGAPIYRRARRLFDS